MGINLILQNNPNITYINCGSSTPRLSGYINISNFTSLTGFVCNNNHITEFSGIQNITGLRLLDLGNNKLTGTINTVFPNMNSNTSLSTFYCYNNLLSGTIPSFNNNIRIFHCGGNKITGFIPNLNANTALRGFYCYGNKISGEIPKLNLNTQLNEFNCELNSLTGNIPSLTNIPFLFQFFCNSNLLTGFDGGPMSVNLGRFNADNNNLKSSTVNSILEAFVQGNRTSGSGPCVLNLGGGRNSKPVGDGLFMYDILIAKGWTITTGVLND